MVIYAARAITTTATAANDKEPPPHTKPDGRQAASTILPSRPTMPIPSWLPAEHTEQQDPSAKASKQRAI